MGRIFISYSHKDEAWKDRLVSQLGVLATEGLDTWDDRRIAGGDEWKAEIDKAIAGCDVALLLISSHFLTSGFILGHEVPPLLQRRESQGVRVIPVIVSPCQWTRVGWLKSIQARPKDGKPLTGMSEHEADEALSNLTGEVHDLLQAAGRLLAAPSPVAGAAATGYASSRQPKISLTHLPQGAPHFLGREAELAVLDNAWTTAGQTHVVQLIAPGGTGKTSLMTHWLDQLKTQQWGGAQSVFGWSFYSQGSGDDRQASEDGFMEAALKFHGVNIPPNTSPWDKGEALALALQAGRHLLILDGLEPLQYPPTDKALPGELKAPGLKTLLGKLAKEGQPGLTLVTSREHLADLADHLRNTQRPKAGVVTLDLNNLDHISGARLLHTLGVNRAGAASIEATDEELQAASREVQGHALTLSLLGSYLARAKGGDVRQLKEVDFARANERTNKGHAFHAMQAYATWFAREAEDGARQLAALRLIGFFDRPATRANLLALRAAPAIPGLTEALVDLQDEDWHFTLSQLKDAGLAQFEPQSGALDAHPLVREYFAHWLQTTQPKAWQEGHRRIFEQLQADTPHQPDTPEGLQPLYQAVAHGCKAGLYRQALEDVYRDRILRGATNAGFFSTKKLGLFGADLGAIACFFEEPWRRPAPQLQESHQSWLFGVASFNLRALGRLHEALEPVRAAAEMEVQLEDWGNAAISCDNLCELQSGLGLLDDAVECAPLAVKYADQSGDAFQKFSRRTTLAYTHFQLGNEKEALRGFEEAERMQHEDQPGLPLLYSLRGFQYCELLLAPAARATWHATDLRGAGAADAQRISPLPLDKEAIDQGLRCCAEVAKRAEQTLSWTKTQGGYLLDEGLDHLSLARSALCADLLQGQPPSEAVRRHGEEAVNGLRAAGQQTYIPSGLLTRAWLRHASGDMDGCKADLDEAHRIASRGGMKLHLADIALYRGRLFRDPAQLAIARKLIEECKYGLRTQELEDAERAANEQNW